MKPRDLIAKAKLAVERARSRFGAVDIGVSTFKNFSAVDGGTYAAALTYYFFFSIFPLLLFGASIVGFLTHGNPELRQEIINAGLRSVPMLSSVMSEETLLLIEERRGQIALTGLGLALYAGTGAIVALAHALNKIHGVVVERNFVGKRIRSLLWLAALGGAVVLSLGLGAVAGYATKFFDGTLAAIMSKSLSHVVGFGIGVLIFGSAFRFLPNRKLSWSEVLPGAMTASVMFEILKEVGTWYLERGARGRTETFGTLAAAAGLLVASYLIAQVTLLAASLNDVVAERRLTRQSSVSENEEERDG